MQRKKKSKFAEKMPSMPPFLKRLDIFGEPVPQFGIDGETMVRTKTGATCSMVIFMLTFAFGLLKLQALVDRKNPFVVSTTEDLEEGHKYPIGNDNFNIAFSIATADDKMLPYNPRYVKWVALEHRQ